MKSILIYLLIIFCFCILTLKSQNEGNENKEVKTVEHVELKKYAGKWYEISKIPNSFQKNCKYGTTANYTLNDDGDIEVVNKCFEEDGELNDAEGLAEVVDTISNAKLRVSFVSIFGIHLFWGDYWIIGIDENYQYAVVGTPNRKYGWILSRTPKLSEEKLNETFNILKDNGYDPGDFELTDQKMN